VLKSVPKNVKLSLKLKMPTVLISNNAEDEQMILKILKALSLKRLISLTLTHMSGKNDSFYDKFLDFYSENSFQLKELGIESHGTDVSVFLESALTKSSNILNLNFKAFEQACTIGASKIKLMNSFKHKKVLFCK
jgi:hypothetical protein